MPYTGSYNNFNHVVNWYAQDLIDAVNGNELFGFNVSQIAMWHAGHDAAGSGLLPFIMIWRAAKRWVQRMRLELRERTIKRRRVIRSLLHAGHAAWR